MAFSSCEPGPPPKSPDETRIAFVERDSKFRADRVKVARLRLDGTLWRRSSSSGALLA